MHSRIRKLQMLEAHFSVLGSLENLGYQVIEVVMVHICLEALFVSCDHFCEEDNWLVQGRDHCLRESHHFLQGEMLLLGELSSSAKQELKLTGNIGECDWTPLVEELIELEVVFELLRIGRVDEVGRSLDISSHEEAADEFHIDLTLFLG